MPVASKKRSILWMGERTSHPTRYQLHDGRDGRGFGPFRCLTMLLRKLERRRLRNRTQDTITD